MCNVSSTICTAVVKQMVKVHGALVKPHQGMVSFAFLLLQKVLKGQVQCHSYFEWQELCMLYMCTTGWI